MDAFSAGSADEFAQRIAARVRILEVFPLAGRVVPEFQLEVVRELIEPPYRIVYEVFPDRAEILAIRLVAQVISAD